MRPLVRVFGIDVPKALCLGIMFPKFPKSFASPRPISINPNIRHNTHHFHR